MDLHIFSSILIKTMQFSDSALRINNLNNSGIELRMDAKYRLIVDDFEIIDLSNRLMLLKSPFHD